MSRYSLLVFGIVLGLVCALPARGEGVLRIATSTTLKSTGLGDFLFPQFTASSGYPIELYSVGSGSALRMGHVGKVDLVITHSPDAEKRFVAEGHGLRRWPVMHNDFLIVGPGNDPAGIAGMEDAVAAFRKLAASGSLFLSRGDDSGTHRKELRIWKLAGIDPYGQEWYLETGTSIDRTLQTSNERLAYTLVDRGTWLAMKSRLRLTLLVQGDEHLQNPYHLIAVNPARHPGVNTTAANTFIEWMRSPEVQRMIAAFTVNGTPLFTPDVAR